MKKFYNLFNGVLFAMLLIAGNLFTSCEQIADPSADSSFNPGIRADLQSLNAAPTVLTSWTTLPNYAAQGGGGGHCVYGNNIFLSANWDDGSIGRSANNGATWTNINSTATTFGANNWVKNLAYLNNAFWAVGKGGHVATSTNGLNWTAIPNNPLTGDAFSISYGAGTYIVVTDANSSGGGSQIALYSNNTWTLVANNPVPNYKIDSVVFSQGKFIIVCNGGWISYTTDSTYQNWATAFQVQGTQGTNSNNFKMAAVGISVDSTSVPRPTVVAVSRYGLAYVYTDGSLAAGNWQWTDIYPSSQYGNKIWLNCVLFDGSKFIVAGQDGAMAFSDSSKPLLQPTDWFVDSTFSWTGGNFKGKYINGIAYRSGGNNMYVATGGDSSPTASRTTP